VAAKRGVGRARAVEAAAERATEGPGGGKRGAGGATQNVAAAPGDEAERDAGAGAAAP
jgi:hypothetical protein